MVVYIVKTIFHGYDLSKKKIDFDVKRSKTFLPKIAQIIILQG